ncbi:hypothetical protein CAEBREN_18018 [Caenorhabditis brenneri]|uniref:Uncharacterized protein n=1 Tax=Caenorhabditis brenneri TaxID=135651 RepID=G0PFH6_CAEBE|nr:hypothetical protein CAEBREN_18018 [Caenorhabditis brenneri]
MENFEPEYLESMDGCEEYLKEFFSGRALFSQKAAHDEQQKNHDEKYERELQYDKRDNAKGKGPYFKQYRKDNINQNSNCDAQYVNNLHVYFGDGSKLKQTPKKIHYAVDLICPNAVDTDATAALKNLEVSRNKKKVSNWVRANRAHIRGPFRRAVSCCDLNIEIPTESPKIVEKPPSKDQYEQSPTLYDLDAEYEKLFVATQQGPPLKRHYIYKNVSITIKRLISKVNAFTYPIGTIKISKVLFSRENFYAYVIPAERDVQQLLVQFSAKFEDWFSRRSDQKTVGTDKDEKIRPRQFNNGDEKPHFWRINVILCLKEFTDEKTVFRRARHVCHIAKERHMFLEIDTGRLRVVDCNDDSVRRMPHEFAHFPTPILEIRFTDVQTQKEMSARIAEIRKTGRAFIGGFDKGNRRAEQLRNYQGSHEEKNWNDLETAVLLPTKKPTPPRLTTFFCDELYCMGLCASTDKFLQKTEVPLTPVGTPTAWIAEKEQKKDKKKRFEFPSNTTSHHLQPIQPLMSMSSPRKSVMTTSPFKSTLEPANMSSFFQR